MGIGTLMLGMRCKMVDGENMSYLLSDTSCFRGIHAAMGVLSLFAGIILFVESFYYIIFIHETPLGFNNPLSVANTFSKIIFNIIRTAFAIIFIAMSNVTFLMIVGLG
jgi:hypothetical protein